MLIATNNPQVFLVRLRDWNPHQPQADRGVGSRSEILIRIECLPDEVVIEYVTTEFYERETAILPWRMHSTFPERQKPFLELIVMAGAMSEIYDTVPRRLKWAIEKTY